MKSLRRGIKIWIKYLSKIDIYMRKRINDCHNNFLVFMIQMTRKKKRKKKRKRKRRMKTGTRNMVVSL